MFPPCFRGEGQKESDNGAEKTKFSTSWKGKTLLLGARRLTPGKHSYGIATLAEEDRRVLTAGNRSRRCGLAAAGVATAGHANWVKCLQC